jgi:GDP-L-fucose synthase
LDSTSTILVTGASGLIGTHLVKKLLEKGFKVRAITHKRKSYFNNEDNLELISGDLTNSKFCNEICLNVDQVYHLAVETGSIAKNSLHPASIMTPTVLMDFNMLKSSHENKITNYLYSSCACVYPADVEDMAEDSAWDGPPPIRHETISWSKRIAELQCRSFFKEFGDNITIVRPSNTYGPYDVFDKENSHVISAFIKKAFEKMDPFVIWGNGEQIREFVYAQDVAEGMILAMKKNSKTDPVNLAGGTSINIKELAQMILNIVGHSPKIQFDSSKPSGHMKRILNNSKAKLDLGFESKTSLEEGLKKTISWYDQNCY